MEMRVKVRLIVVMFAILSMVIYRSCYSISSQKNKNDVSLVVMVSTDTFDEKVLKSTVPVVAKFYASWCGPCKRMEPTDKNMACEFKNVSIVKIDVDNNIYLVQKWGVQSYPTYFFFKDGTKRFMQVGSMDEVEYREKIKKLIS